MRMTTSNPAAPSALHGAVQAPPAAALNRRVSTRRSTLSYLVLVVLPLLALAGVLELGSRHGVPLSGFGESVAVRGTVTDRFALPLFLIQIGVILAACRVVGRLLQKLGQPMVVGEMLAGLLLGPSLLGLVAPQLYAQLFPPGTVRFLNAVAQLGVVLFMFVMGLEINLRDVLRRGQQSVVTSHAGIALPLFSGGVAALFLYPSYATGRTSFPVFALFLGCAMSITAFPVLARMLGERGLSGTAFGAMAMECAALADVSAWVILAVVVGLMRGNAQGALVAVAWVLAGLALYLGVMFAVVRPLVRRLWLARARGEERESHSPSDGELSAVLLLILASAISTELLHIHALFGAFFAGVIMPEDARMREAIAAPFRQLLTVLLLPIFFAYAGLRANLGTFSSSAEWVLCGAMIVVAVGSKFGGSLLAARAMGASWRNAGALGSLMNARGLVELVLLTLGLQLGIITQSLFTAMVVMALVTTAMATPMVSRLLGPQGQGKPADGFEGELS